VKLTTKQIREIIKEELRAVLEGKYRTIYAPGPVPDDYADYKTSRHPGNTEFETRPVERGSHIEYHTDPFSELDPLIQQKVPRGEASQAYELQRALDPEFGQGEYPDFTGMSPEEIEVHKEKEDNKTKEDFMQGMENYGKDFVEKELAKVQEELAQLRKQIRKGRRTLPKDELKALYDKKVDLLTAEAKLLKYHHLKKPYSDKTTRITGGTRFNKRRPVRKDK